MSSRLPRPIRRIRRVFKRINYYSADRTRAWWRTAADWWLFLSLPMAITVVFLLDAHVSRKHLDVWSVEVRMGRLDRDGPLFAKLEYQPERSWNIPVPVAEAKIINEQTARGWPMATTEVNGPIRMDVRFFDGRERSMVGPFGPGEDENPADETVRTAIVTALEAENLEEEAAAWIAGTRETGPNILAFVASILLAWALLFLLALPLLQLLRAAIATGRNHRQRRTVRRLKDGLCPNCRYNLAGERFPERCPECGTRIWGS